MGKSLSWAIDYQHNMKGMQMSTKSKTPAASKMAPIVDAAKIMVGNWAADFGLENLKSPFAKALADAVVAYDPSVKYEYYKNLTLGQKVRMRTKGAELPSVYYVVAVDMDRKGVWLRSAGSWVTDTATLFAFDRIDSMAVV